MQIRDRIKELRRVPANQLRPNPKNWRTHPAEQQDALRGVLSEIGYAGALLARELADGSLELIDGHLRAETTPDVPVPVLVLDVTEEEADKLLATYDSLSAIAGVDLKKLDALLPRVQTDSPAMQEMLTQLAAKAKDDARFQQCKENQSNEIGVPELFQIVVQCADEAQQCALYEQLVSEGYECRVLTL
ncbi:MAG TPA: ParB N-terminal domain-containing protein [Pirellulales bacterium]|jgi:hypothetical protein